MEIISIIRKTATVIITFLVLCQVVTSMVFCWRARKVKEINWVPKFIMALAGIEGIMWSSLYISAVFFKSPYPTNVIFVMNIVSSITLPIIFGLLIGFERVQVQLRA